MRQRRAGLIVAVGVVLPMCCVVVSAHQEPDMLLDNQLEPWTGTVPALDVPEYTREAWEGTEEDYWREDSAEDEAPVGRASPPQRTIPAAYAVTSDEEQAWHAGRLGLGDYTQGRCEVSDLQMDVDYRGGGIPGGSRLGLSVVQWCALHLSPLFVSLARALSLSFSKHACVHEDSVFFSVKRYTDRQHVRAGSCQWCDAVTYFAAFTFTAEGVCELKTAATVETRGPSARTGAVSGRHAER
eukprot:COSAG01_NODE_67_length_29188_cov_1135.609474_37_plen_241_part_00